MQIDNLLEQLHYGELHLKRDEATGLLAIIAIHSTRLGPALGGCRLKPYTSLEEAIIDALRLAQGMSYKAAIHQLPLGGGKAVIIEPLVPYARTALFQAFGNFVHSLGGKYITAEDVGTNISDMDIIRTVTPYVTGNSQPGFTTNDPSPLTALGILRGIEACVQFQLQRNSLTGLHVAIQGLGNVGYKLAELLHQHGAKLTVCDMRLTLALKAQQILGATIVTPEIIDTIPCDVYAPCALGNAVNYRNINILQAKIIAGSANNLLESPMLAQNLKERGILYAPDYVINGGGLIHATAQYLHHSEAQAKIQVMQIYDTLLGIFQRAEKENVAPAFIADTIAKERLFSSAH